MSFVYVNNHVNFGWQEYSESYTINCQVCNKAMHRTINDGCNRTASREYINDLLSKLETRAEHLSQSVKETCASCIRARLGSTEDYEYLDVYEYLTHEKVLGEQIIERLRTLRTGAKYLQDHYKNHIVIFKEQEWVVSYFEYSTFQDCYMVSLSCIHKTKPWLTTQDQQHVPLRDVKLTDQNFNERVEKAKGENNE